MNNKYPQGSFWAWAQPMRDDVILQHRLSLAGCIHLASFYPTDAVRTWNMINSLTHWGRVTQICVGKPTIIGSDNGLSPLRRQAIIWTNAGILLIRPLGTNFSEIFIDIRIFSFKKMLLKMSSAKWRPYCLDLNVLSLIDAYMFQ